MDKIPLAVKLSHANMTARRAPAVLGRERHWVRSHLAENSPALWSHHIVPGVTKLGCRNGAATWAKCSGGAVRSHRVYWGKPVFLITASSQLAESLARGRVPFQRDGTGKQAERRPD